MIWRSAAHPHINKLQVLQYKCLRIAVIAPWYDVNNHIHGDMGTSYLADLIRAHLATDRLRLERGLPVLMDLKTKHTDWNSRMIAPRVRFYVITLPGTHV
jgi:hypothetical protein